MLKYPPKLSPAEFEIMQVLWNHDSITINAVMEEINIRREEPVKRTTVQVQLSRLEEKGWIKHETVGRIFYYSPLFSREDASADILQDVTERVFGGSSSEMVKFMFDSKMITKDELNELRGLLENQDKGEES